ncbi:major facilitator superfamily domain-containing protein [Nemania abortiva]|nr:major facilitator superfamily domain-containing protein [Nemania abortiva]
MLVANEMAPQANKESVMETEKITNEKPADIEAIPMVDDADEATQHLERLRKQYSATWDSPDDPKDPYNWSSWKKISIGIVMGLGALVTLVTASVTAAALGDIARDLHLDPATAQISFSVYFLGLAFGPFPIAAISEMNGRRNIWIAANIWFILWNSLCPVGYSKGLMIAGRFLAALGASVGNTLAAPVMTDLFHEKDRGKSLAIAGLLPYLGPALGPIIGGLVSQLIAWPWLFYIVSIIDTVVLVIGILILRETYTPILLRRKAAAMARLDQATAVATPAGMNQWVFWQDFFARLRVNMLRPFRILFYRPVMQLVTLNMGLAFGIYTLMLSTFAQLWVERYGQSKLSSSLHYISISVGISLATQIGGRAMDWIYRRLRERHARTSGVGAGGKLPPGKPEYRVPYMLPGVLLMPAGLFWYGWSAQYHYHWIIVDIGAAVFTMGSFISRFPARPFPPHLTTNQSTQYSQALNAYILDEFREYGASAIAAVRILSQILGFAFPIFAPQLYETLDYGWGNSLLALVFVVLAFPVPGCLWLWGEKLRAMGRRRTEDTTSSS